MFCIAQVYEQDEDNDEDELKDTLIRIAKLSMPFTSKESADTSSEISLFDVLAFLSERQAVSKCRVSCATACACFCVLSVAVVAHAAEAAIIAAAIELDEPAIIEALLSFTENKVRAGHAVFCIVCFGTVP